MLEPVTITTWEEYTYCTDRGCQPLLYSPLVKMDIELRVEVQRELFGLCKMGPNRIPQANERFYRWCWEFIQQDAWPHWCEETGSPLYTYRAEQISHILSKGGHPDMAHDPRNINILTLRQHDRWENGPRQQMQIYTGNMRRVELLKTEYACLRL